LAKNRLERARTFEFDNLDEFEETAAPVDVNGLDVSGSDYRFQRTTTISSVAVNLKEIIVMVEIRDRVSLAFEGEAESVRSLFAEYIEPVQ
jgi:hypothetical protein